MLQAGDLLAGRYTLEAQLGAVGFYITTWRAKDARGGLVVLRHVALLTTDDDYAPGPPHRLGEALAPLLPDLRRLVERQPACTLSPWLDLHVDDAEPWLLLARPYYPQPLADCAGLDVDGAEAPPVALLDLMEQLGCGLDELAHYGGLEANVSGLSPTNLFFAAGRPVLVDYGLRPLIALVEQSYSGPRPGGTLQACQLLACYGPYLPGIFPQRPPVDAQVVLAALYYWLRSGLGLFSGQELAVVRAGGLFALLQLAQPLIAGYLSGAELPLAGLSSPRERDVLVQALALDPARRYPSWRELLAALRAVSD